MVRLSFSKFLICPEKIKRGKDVLRLLNLRTPLPFDGVMITLIDVFVNKAVAIL